MPHKYTPEERISVFWSKVDKSGGDDACWLWTAGLFPSGYGHFYVDGKHCGAHRYAWILTNGAIPNGLEVLHNCPTGDNQRCVNPSHLFLGTQQDNVDDMYAKGRAGKCNGEDQHLSKLTAGDIPRIRSTYLRGSVTLQQLADVYHVSFSTIHCVIKRTTWKHIL